MARLEEDLVEVKEELELTLRRAGEQEAGKRELEGQLRARAADLEQQRDGLAARVDRLLESLANAQGQIEDLQRRHAPAKADAVSTPMRGQRDGAAASGEGTPFRSWDSLASRSGVGSAGATPEHIIADRQVIGDVKKHAKLQVDRANETARTERLRVDQLSETLRRTELRLRA